MFSKKLKIRDQKLSAQEIEAILEQDLSIINCVEEERDTLQRERDALRDRLDAANRMLENLGYTGGKF